MSLAKWLGGDLQSLGGRGWGLTFVVAANLKARDDSGVLKRGTVLFGWLPGCERKRKRKRQKFRPGSPFQAYSVLIRLKEE